MRRPGDDGELIRLQRTDEEKDLGVMVDSKLSFDSHISSAVSRGNRIAGVIRRSFTHLPPAVFNKLFRALVRPHLEYAQAVWHPTKRMHINALERVQRRASKQVPGLRSLSYPDRLRRLKLPTLVFRRLRGDMVEVYKSLHHVYDRRTSRGTLNLVNNTRTRGHSLKLQKPRARRNVRLNCFGHRVVNDWNQLPEEVVSAPSLNTFKNRLDRHWTDHPALYNPDI